MQLEDYLRQEEQAAIRHEYLGGEIKAMAYASPAHELIGIYYNKKYRS